MPRTTTFYMHVSVASGLTLEFVCVGRHVGQPKIKKSTRFHVESGSRRASLFNLTNLKHKTVITLYNQPVLLLHNYVVDTL